MRRYGLLISVFAIFAWIATAQATLTLNDISDAQIDNDSAPGEASPPSETGFNKLTISDLGYLQSTLDSGEDLSSPVTEAEFSVFIRSDEIQNQRANQIAARRRSICVQKVERVNKVQSDLDRETRNLCRRERQSLERSLQSVSSENEVNSVREAARNLQRCAENKQTASRRAMVNIEVVDAQDCAEFGDARQNLHASATQLGDAARLLFSVGDEAETKASQVLSDIESRREDNRMKMFAFGATALIAGAAANDIGVDNAMRVMEAAAADIFSDGETGQLLALNQELMRLEAQSRQSSFANTQNQSPNAADRNQSLGPKKKGSVTFSCGGPGEKPRTIDFDYRSEGCRAASEKAIPICGCNDVDKCQMAQQQLVMACARDG